MGCFLMDRIWIIKKKTNVSKVFILRNCKNRLSIYRDKKTGGWSVPGPQKICVSCEQEHNIPA